jgi:ribosomal protein S18 acetylase RimI-like enzyme
VTASVRRLAATDLTAVGALAAAAFGIVLDSPRASARWRGRLSHPFETDPGGSFVALEDGRIVGVAQAIQRERLWVLSTLAVDPRAQSAGVGRALLARALDYGAPAEGLIVSSNDARALRLYAQAGFTLLPTFHAQGPPRGEQAPVPPDGLRELGPGQLEPLAAISREVRGAPHTAELEFALSRGGRLLALEGRGFAVATPGQGVWALAARDGDAARALLWNALTLVGESDRPSVRWLTGGQRWAVEVAVDAGLRLTSWGALCVRGNPGPLAPYIPSGPFA